MGDSWALIHSKTDHERPRSSEYNVNQLHPFMAPVFSTRNGIFQDNVPCCETQIAFEWFEKHKMNSS